MTRHDELEYRSFALAKGRCRNPNSLNYKNWGGRGIEFRFETYEAFLAEVGRRPTPEHTIDRIDNDGHYEPGNVRWATRAEQNANRRPKQYTTPLEELTLNDRTQPVTEWARETGISVHALRWRIKAAWDVARMLSTPTKYKRPKRR
jgi:hypothetical protein